MTIKARSRTQSILSQRIASAARGASSASKRKSQSKRTAARKKSGPQNHTSAYRPEIKSDIEASYASVMHCLHENLPGGYEEFLFPQGRP